MMDAGGETGAARLSSARAVRRWVHSQNGQNPRRQLPGDRLSGETAPERGRKVRMTSSWRGLDALGDTHATVSRTMGCQPARGSYLKNLLVVRIAVCNPTA